VSILDAIVEQKKIEVKNLHNRYTFKSFSEFEFYSRACINFADSISLSDRICLIAEIKKASPSSGILREYFNYKDIATVYYRAGVQAVSILTDEYFFKGSLNYLSTLASNKDRPLLRKDFIIDEFQVLESKAFGADAILLIAEILSENQIRDLTETATEIGMHVLLEVHSVDQLNKINFAHNRIIGINNRNLNDFSLDLKTTAKVKNGIPDDCIVVSESGISSMDDINFLKGLKFNAVLVGGYFMKSLNIEKTVTDFMIGLKYES